MVLPQIVTVGVYDSNIVARNTAVSKKRRTSMFEIELPIEAGGLSHIDDVTLPITPTRLICAKPGQVRHSRFPFRCYYIHIVLHEGPLYDALMQVPTFPEPADTAPYKALFERMIPLYHSLSGDDEIQLYALLLELIYMLKRDTPALAADSAHGKRSNDAIEAALAYIHEHLTEELSLERVANAVSLSPVYFHNAFKTAVSKTLRNYVEEQRIKKAINLLLTTNYSLTQIAYECGFSSQSYFSYVFKRRMQQTPRQYVQKIYGQYEI